MEWGGRDEKKCMRKRKRWAMGGENREILSLFLVGILKILETYSNDESHETVIHLLVQN